MARDEYTLPAVAAEQGGPQELFAEPGRVGGLVAHAAQLDLGQVGEDPAQCLRGVCDAALQPAVPVELGVGQFGAHRPGGEAAEPEVAAGGQWRAVRDS
ncbi:hypothetical protein [Catellatospora sp. NPDC049609]|uniref:hypothetical protein n=1 Tax=Catellatospora sp. NPDC049609 TaxID=3155505 RepID=UPI0034262546